jgi:LemA protein
MQTSWIVIVILLATALGVVAIYNRLVRRRNLVREAWSGIDVQLRRRTDLIPNLVETVKAYAAHERGLFDEVAAQRASSIAAADVRGQAAAESALQGSLRRVIALAEAYPQLKADQNFRALQTQLTEIEDQLQMARRYYNGTVRDLNIGIQSFPTNLMAGPLGFHEHPFFELEDRAAASAPTVAFAGQP